MARERWPNARRSSGANQRALRRSAGFFVTAQKIGWELNVYLLGLLAAVLITGPGAWSLDAALGLTRRHSATEGPAAARRAGQRSASY